MRLTLSALLFFVLLASSAAYSQTHYPSPTSNPSVTSSATNTTSPNFQLIGIDRNQVATFLTQIKTAIKSKQPAKNVAPLIGFPLRVNQAGHKHLLITSKHYFIKRYNLLFTQKIKHVVLQQKINTLFVNSQGIMLGQGELWLRTTGNAKQPLKIFFINLKTPSSKPALTK